MNKTVRIEENAEGWLVSDSECGAAQVKTATEALKLVQEQDAQLAQKLEDEGKPGMVVTVIKWGTYSKVGDAVVRVLTRDTGSKKRISYSRKEAK